MAQGEHSSSLNSSILVAHSHSREPWLDALASFPFEELPELQGDSFAAL